jgi:hypothetical protein
LSAGIYKANHHKTIQEIEARERKDRFEKIEASLINNEKQVWN